jgi:hypothetical protein
VAFIRSWLLVEYPSAWRRNAVADSRLLSDTFKQHVRSIDARTLLIRRDHRRGERIRCFFVRSCESPPSMVRFEISDYDNLLLEDFRPEPAQELLYAVCTHGRHDKCCAKFGLPLYCALRDQVHERVWQCSHVGGDRFAGNVVVFPYGLYYGHVTPDDVAEIVHRSERGEVWLKGYRGRSCFSRPVQVAEYFLRSESGRLEIDEFHLIDLLPSGGNRRQVRFQARSDASVHLVEYAVESAALNEFLTCGAAEPSTVPQYELIRYAVTRP